MTRDCRRRGRTGRRWQDLARADSETRAGPAAGRQPQRRCCGNPGGPGARRRPASAAAIVAGPARVQRCHGAARANESDMTVPPMYHQWWPRPPGPARHESQWQGAVTVAVTVPQAASASDSIFQRVKFQILQGDYHDHRCSTVKPGHVTVPVTVP